MIFLEENFRHRLSKGEVQLNFALEEDIITLQRRIKDCINNMYLVL